LDLGCGNGIITSNLLPLFPDTHYTLLDASDKMLELSEIQFGLQNKTYVSSYFQDYEFQDQCFDMVVAGFSLHHCPAEDKQELFKSIFKSLKIHGGIMCSDLKVKPNYL
jgi:ubiquinone/menaquinone biosynthesis C-methylase UbiE